MYDSDPLVGICMQVWIKALPLLSEYQVIRFCEYLLRLLLLSWVRAHAQLTADHFHDATRHSGRVPSCEFPLRVSV